MASERPVRKPPAPAEHEAQCHTFTRSDLFRDGEEKIGKDIAQRLEFYLHKELNDEVDLSPNTIWAVTFHRLKK